MTNNPNLGTILVVEDDPDISALLQIHLGDLGYALDTADNGRDGLELALSRAYALVILDLMLPGLDGLEICKRIRREDARVPILMLTARSEELDKVLGLELGADDYMTKPFSIRELIARVKAIFRRLSVEQDTPPKPCRAPPGLWPLTHRPGKTQGDAERICD